MGCFIPDWIQNQIIKGCQESSKKICQRLVKAYKFDFNKHIENGVTFEEKLRKLI
ncbi:unnamed protein product [Moneuplotes crassus]|uniref:Uncharacterized protein n=1 Tax=Euplotes crassus TaxID=5936 RepID=A0AAD2D7L0_EUPCR|nr:unnamed protein product [Moneuplotes crassus]